MSATEANTSAIIDRIYNHNPRLAARVASVIHLDRRRPVDDDLDEASLLVLIKEAIDAGLIRTFTAEHGAIWMERND